MKNYLFAGSEEKKAAPPSKPPSGTELMASGVFEVVMIKGPTGVGFCLEGGKASPLGDLPIVIKRIFKGQFLLCFNKCVRERSFLSFVLVLLSIASLKACKAKIEQEMFIGVKKYYGLKVICLLW